MRRSQRLKGATKRKISSPASSLPPKKKKKKKKKKKDKEKPKASKSEAAPEAEEKILEPDALAAIVAMQEKMKNALAAMEKAMLRIGAGTSKAASPKAPESKEEVKEYRFLDKSSSAYRVWRSFEAQYMRYIRAALVEAGFEDAPQNWLHLTEEQIRQHYATICASPRLLKNLPAGAGLPPRNKGDVLYSSGLRRLMQNFLCIWTKSAQGRPDLIGDSQLKDVRDLAVSKLMLTESLKMPVRVFTPLECKQIWSYLTAEPVSVLNCQRLMFYLVHVFLGLRTGRSVYTIKDRFFLYSKDRDTLFVRGASTKVKIKSGQTAQEVMFRHAISPQTKVLNNLFCAYRELRKRCNPTEEHFFLQIKANANVSVIVALKENLEVFEDAPISRHKQRTWLRDLAQDAGVSTTDIAGRTLRCLHALAQTKAGLAHTWESNAIQSYLRENSNLGSEYEEITTGGSSAKRVMAEFG